MCIKCQFITLYAFKKSAYTILFPINTPGALHFSNKGRLFELNFERENCYKIALKAWKLPQNDEL